MNLPAFIPGQECPCGCGETGSKLQTRYPFHVTKTCACLSCRGRRAQKKGKRGQALMHTRLGGTGFVPSNEESARPYTIEVTVMPESKHYAKPPASFTDFITSEWFRKAIGQSERAVPVGSGARPCVVVRGSYAIVDIRPKRSQVVGKERTE